MNYHAVITASAPSQAAQASLLAAGPSVCRYYVGEGSQASELVGRGMTLMYAHVDAVDRFQRRHRADAVHMTADGRIHALAYEYERGDPEDEAPPARAGLTFVGREDSFSEDEVDERLRVHLYQPDKRTPSGQAIAQQVRAIWPFNLSRWFLGELGLLLGQARRDPLAPASSAFARNRQLLVCLAGNHTEPGAFEPPPWLCEISQTEFNQLMEGR